MRATHLGISAAGCTLLVLGATWLFEMPLTRAAILAPIIVASVGATAFILVLWTKVAVESLRGSAHPARILAGGVAVFALLVVLSFFVDVPARH